MHLDKAKQRSQDLYALNGRQPVPCTTAEVEDLEQWCGHRLPAAYREFLLWMGHDGGGFLQGSDCFYRYLKTLTASGQALLEEDHFIGTLPENTFVFFMHQGYQFNFFSFDDGDDPPVYLYYEEEPVRTQFVQIYAHFSDFMLTEMEGHIEALRMHQEFLKSRNSQSKEQK